MMLAVKKDDRSPEKIALRFFLPMQAAQSPLKNWIQLIQP